MHPPSVPPVQSPPIRIPHIPSRTGKKTHPRKKSFPLFNGKQIHRRRSAFLTARNRRFPARRSHFTRTHPSASIDSSRNSGQIPLALSCCIIYSQCCWLAWSRSALPPKRFCIKPRNVAPPPRSINAFPLRKRPAMPTPGVASSYRWSGIACAIKRLVRTRLVPLNLSCTVTYEKIWTPLALPRLQSIHQQTAARPERHPPRPFGIPPPLAFPPLALPHEVVAGSVRGVGSLSFSPKIPTSQKIRLFT